MDRLSILTKHLTFILENAFPDQAKQMQEELASLKPRRARRPDPVRLNAEMAVWEGVTGADLERWKALFPGVDLLQELRRAAAWVIGHPARAKKSYTPFLVRWMSRAYTDLTGTRLPRRVYSPRPVETADERAARRAGIGIER